MIITVAALKGGVGKTTTAVLLALALDQRRRTAPILIDGDRQGSATTWRELAGDDWPGGTLGDPLPWPEPLIPNRKLTEAVIDTGPGDPSRIAAAAAVSDVVVVPTGPRYGDVSQIGPTLDVVAKAVGDRPITLGVLLTMRRGSGASRGRGSSIPARQARAALDELEVPCWATEIPLHDAIAGTFGTAPARIPGAYIDLLDEIEGTLTDG